MNESVLRLIVLATDSCSLIPIFDAVTGSVDASVAESVDVSNSLLLRLELCRQNWMLAWLLSLCVIWLLPQAADAVDDDCAYRCEYLKCFAISRMSERENRKTVVNLVHIVCFSSLVCFASLICVSFVRYAWIHHWFVDWDQTNRDRHNDFIIKKDADSTWRRGGIERCGDDDNIYENTHFCFLVSYTVGICGKSERG